MAALMATWTAPARAQEDVRALWVVRTTLTSPAAVSRMVDVARASGFNTLVVQVRGRGDAYYRGGLEPPPVALTTEPRFDPLAATIARAHDAGLRVHAWINVNLVASAVDPPVAREHVIYRHPEWLMVPRALGAGLATVDPHSPEYLGRLSRYVRAQSSDIEGLYLSPIPAGAVEYTASVVRDIVSRYAVDGVHLDYVRYPSADFDYSRAALDAFAWEVNRDLPRADPYRRRLAREPLVYTEAFPERWRAFRTARLTALLARLRDVVKSARPAATVSVAVGPDAGAAAADRLQDWGAWATSGLVDVICPMAYTADAATFSSQIAAAREVAGSTPLWAGIGAFRLSSAQIVDDIGRARRLGVRGIILFSYDSLTAPSRGADDLTQLGRALASDQ
ncbi:MAG: glycoside hydrolase family 10 protein [Betaproteobacteria bacterium]